MASRCASCRARCFISCATSTVLRIADSLDTQHRSRVEQVVATRMGEAIVLDLVVRDGPSRDDAQLMRKADLFREELGMELRVTVARPVDTSGTPSREQRL